MKSVGADMCKFVKQNKGGANVKENVQGYSKRQ